VHLLERDRHRTANKTSKETWLSSTVTWWSDCSSAPASRQTVGGDGDVIRTAARPRRLNLTVAHCHQRVDRPPSTDVDIFVDKLANVLYVVSGCSNLLLLCGDVNWAYRRLTRVLMNDCQWRSWSWGWLNTRCDRLLDVVVSDDAIPVRNVLLWVIVSDSAGISDRRIIRCSRCSAGLYIQSSLFIYITPPPPILSVLTLLCNY